MSFSVVNESFLVIIGTCTKNRRIVILYIFPAELIENTEHLGSKLSGKSQEQMPGTNHENFGFSKIFGKNRKGWTFYLFFYKIFGFEDRISEIMKLFKHQTKYTQVLFI